MSLQSKNETVCRQRVCLWVCRHWRFPTLCCEYRLYGRVSKVVEVHFWELSFVSDLKDSAGILDGYTFHLVLLRSLYLMAATEAFHPFIIFSFTFLNDLWINVSDSLKRTDLFEGKRDVDNVLDFKQFSVIPSEITPLGFFWVIWILSTFDFSSH